MAANGQPKIDRRRSYRLATWMADVRLVWTGDRIQFVGTTGYGEPMLVGGDVERTRREALGPAAVRRSPRARRY
jgi:hypothetical protein